MQVKKENSWALRLHDEFNKPYFIELTQFVKEEYRIATVFPPGKEIFRAFDCWGELRKGWDIERCPVPESNG